MADLVKDTDAAVLKVTLAELKAAKDEALRFQAARDDLKRKLDKLKSKTSADLDRKDKELADARSDLQAAQVELRTLEPQVGLLARKLTVLQQDRDVELQATVSQVERLKHQLRTSHTNAMMAPNEGGDIIVTVPLLEPSLDQVEELSETIAVAKTATDDTAHQLERCYRQINEARLCDAPDNDLKFKPISSLDNALELVPDHTLSNRDLDDPTLVRRLVSSLLSQNALSPTRKADVDDTLALLGRTDDATTRSAALDKVARQYGLAANVMRACVCIFGTESSGKSVICNALIGQLLSFSHGQTATHCAVKYVCTINSDANLSFVVHLPKALQVAPIADGLREHFGEDGPGRHFELDGTTFTTTRPEVVQGINYYVMTTLAKEERMLFDDVLTVEMSGPADQLLFGGVLYDLPGLPTDTAGNKKQRDAIEASTKIFDSIVQDKNLQPFFLAVDRCSQTSTNNSSLLIDRMLQHLKKPDTRKRIQSIIRQGRWLSINTHADQGFEQNHINSCLEASLVQPKIDFEVAQNTVFVSLKELFAEDFSTADDRVFVPNYTSPGDVNQNLDTLNHEVIQLIEAQGGVTKISERCSTKIRDTLRSLKPGTNFGFAPIRERVARACQASLVTTISQTQDELSLLQRRLSRLRLKRYPTKETVSQVVEQFVVKFGELSLGCIGNRTPSCFVLDDELKCLHAQFPLQLVPAWPSGDVRQAGKPLADLLRSELQLELTVSDHDWEEMCNPDAYLPFQQEFANTCLVLLTRMQSVSITGVTEKQLRQLSGVSSFRGIFAAVDWESAVNALVRRVSKLRTTHLLCYVRQVVQHCILRSLDMTLARTIEEIRANVHPGSFLQVDLVSYYEPVATLRRQVAAAAVSLLEEKFAMLEARFERNDSRNRLLQAATLSGELDKLAKKLSTCNSTSATGSWTSACQEFSSAMSKVADLASQGGDRSVLAGQLLGSDPQGAVEFAELQLASNSAWENLEIFNFLTTELQPMLFDDVHKSLLCDRMTTFATRQVLFLKYPSPCVSASHMSGRAQFCSGYSACNDVAINTEALQKAYWLDKFHTKVTSDEEVNAVKEAVAEAQGVVSRL
eukprot:m.3628 g.3628  ORF g.3628 m.3628 type:complete len:1087 (+) comp6238_c0_seq1:2244-5504(+)